MNEIPSFQDRMVEELDQLIDKIRKCARALGRSGWCPCWARRNMTEPRKFARATVDEAAIGWTLSYRALQEVQDLARATENVSQEDVEAVILALAQLGYVSTN